VALEDSGDLADDDELDVVVDQRLEESQGVKRRRDQLASCRSRSTLAGDSRRSRGVSDRNDSARSRSEVSGTSSELDARVVNEVAAVADELLDRLDRVRPDG
jgi:hypothetical protein